MLPIVPWLIGGGVVLAGGTALALRKKKIPAGVANAAIASNLTPAQQAAAAQPLSPAVQAVLVTRGPEPGPAAINMLKQQQAAGTLDIDNLLKSTDGSLFQKTSPQMKGVSIADADVAQFIVTDNLTVDVLGAGMQIPAIPSGNMAVVIVAPPDLKTKTILVKSVDPRLPDNMAPFTIPFNSVTGGSPAGTFQT